MDRILLIFTNRWLLHQSLDVLLGLVVELLLLLRLQWKFKLTELRSFKLLLDLFFEFHEFFFYLSVKIPIFKLVLALDDILTFFSPLVAPSDQGHTCIRVNTHLRNH